MYKTIAEAFNAYRNKTVAELEARAAEIRGIIATDANADVDAFNIELEGIRQAKENAEERSAQNGGGSFNVITGAATGAKKFDAETVFDTPEYRSAFLKTMLNKPLSEVERSAFAVGMAQSEKRADAYNTSANSSAVLPTETLNEVVRKARTIGGLLAEARAFNMPTRISIPVGDVHSAAVWHTEGAEVQSEEAKTASVVFDGYEVIKIFSISEKVRRMSVPAFEAYLTDELTACVMECIANALVNGTGSAQGTGLNTIEWANGTNAVEIGAGATVAYADVVNLIALMKRGYSAGAKFAMNNATLYRSFYGMVDGNKRPVFIADAQGDKIGKILGFEVVVDDNIADGDVYFGNFKKYLGYNLPEGISIAISRESSFKKGLVDYRAMAIADTKPIVTEAFVKMYKANA